MRLEDRVRDNLKAAGNRLLVPEPVRRPAPTVRPPWRRPIGIVVIAALATFALVALPAILVTPGEPGTANSTQVSTPEPVPSTAPPTTSPPTSTTTAPQATTAPVEAIPPIGETITTETARFMLRADGNLEETPPTASILLRTSSPDGVEILDEAQVGEPDSFFYNVVIDVDGVCSFFASEPVADRVVIQIRLSASLGCSQPYVFELREGSLVEVEANAEEVASLFVSAWQSGDEATMTGLASPEAVESALGVSSSLTEPTFESCDGAAGSIYCSYSDGGQTIVIRVQNVEPPPTVVEVRQE